MAVRYDGERKRWKVEFEQAGERVFHRLPKGCTRAQAETWEGLKRREIFDRVSLDKKPDLTIGEAIDLWLQDNRRKNQRGAASEAKQWEPWRGKLLKDAPEVATEAVRQWTRLALVAGRQMGVGATDAALGPKRNSSQLRGRPVGTHQNGRSGLRKASTVNRRLMLLKAVCKRSWRQKLIGENLSGRIETLREPAHKERFLTHAEARALVKHSPSAKVGQAITTLVYTGLRATELTSLTAGDLRKGTLSVLGKGGKRRAVPVPPIASTAARLALPLGLSYWQLRKEFIKARKAAKLGPDVTLHTCRHTYASWFMQQDGNLFTLAKLLGHSMIYVTARYGHLAEEHLKAAVVNLK